MTDLEMTRLCAEAMGLVVSDLQVTCSQPSTVLTKNGIVFDQYSPLTDDAQAMALVKRFGMHIICESALGLWHVAADAENRGSRNKDLNRAIVECVAKTQAAKK